MLLKEFVSNENVKAEIANYMQKGNLPHAIIIDGAKGTGKKTLAKIIADYCVCLSDKEKPCGICEGCIKTKHNSHPDIYIIDGNASSALSVDNIRKMRSDVYIKPNESPTKVYMLFDCDKMLASAQNALLKILEEPPGSTVFIITVTSANMLLQTVRSRARIFSLAPADVSAAADYVQSMVKGSQEDYCKHVAEVCDGNIGNMIAMFGEETSKAQSLAESLLEAILLSSEYTLLTLTNRLASSRDFAASVLDCMLNLTSECLKASYGLETNSKTAYEISRRLSKKRISSIAENVQKAKGILGTNVNLNFFCTWLSSVLKV